MRTTLLLILLAGLCAEASAPPQPQRSGNGGPVIVELFTSQGCSSCPPADALLRKLARDPRVIPLAFHVDYWNHLGWRDPFSSKEWTIRQMQYVRGMKLRSAYTPQAVIAGTRELVGSNEAAVRAAIDAAAAVAPEASLRLTRAGDSAKVRGESARKDLDLFVVVYENGVTTNVARGENSGRELTNDAIVRRLIAVGKVDGAELTVALQLDPSWKDVGVAAFAQDPATLRIVAAAR